MHIAKINQDVFVNENVAKQIRLLNDISKLDKLLISKRDKDKRKAKKRQYILIEQKFVLSLSVITSLSMLHELTSQKL